MMSPDIAVVGTVKSMGLEDDGVHLKLHVPALTQFPIDVYKVPAEDAEGLKPNKSYSIRLLRGALRQDKDPSKDWNYKWLWGGLAEQTAEELPFGEPEEPVVSDSRTPSAAPRAVAAPKPVDYGMADHPTKTAGFRMMRALEMTRWYMEKIMGGESHLAKGEPLTFLETSLNVTQQYYAGIVAIEEGTRQDTED
jgi:hypothetical protein